MQLIINITVMFTALHFVGGAWYAIKARKFKRTDYGNVNELAAQHHEKCAMLGLIALAVLWKG